MRQPVPGGREQHRDFLAHFLQQGQHLGDGNALGAVVHQHVEQRELDLAHGLHAAL